MMMLLILRRYYYAARYVYAVTPRSRRDGCRHYAFRLLRYGAIAAAAFAMLTPLMRMPLMMFRRYASYAAAMLLP